MVQGEGEAEIRLDEFSFPNSHQVTENPSQDGAVEEDDDSDTDGSGGSVSAEQRSSPPENLEDIQPPKTESLKPEPHTAAGTPESIGLDETDRKSLDAGASLVEGLMKAEKLDEILQKLGYRMVKESDVKETKDSSSSESQTKTNTQGHDCDRCTKTFSRACELRYVKRCLTLLRVLKKDVLQEA